MKSLEEFLQYKDNDNIIIGLPKEWENSTISINGKNNYLVFDGDVLLVDSKIEIKGNNSIVYICGAKRSKTRIYVTIFTNSVFYLGRETSTTKTIRCILSEGKHIFIGAKCLFSFDIWLRNSDAHLIYDSNTNARISKSKSIYIGDHIWIGQQAFIGKGTIIGSGSIIGARSLITGKTIPSNCIVAGTNGRIVKTDVFWNRPCVHSFDKKQINEAENFDGNEYKYEKDRHTHSFKNIENKINSMQSSKERYEYIKENFADKYRKNRFFIPTPMPKTKKEILKERMLKFIKSPK